MKGPGGLPLKSLEMFHDREATSSKRKLRKYESAIDTSCAFETNDLNLTTANFDSYGNVSFDPCEFTLHTEANAENNDCSTHSTNTVIIFECICILTKE
jgi:hypothetical protein